MASGTDFLHAWLWAFAAAVTLQLVVGIVGLVRRDNGLVDVIWGPTIVLAGWAGTISAGHFTWRSWLILGMATVWAARLAWHIGSRHKRSTTEDWRYANWREQWGALWWLRSLGQVYLLQAVLGTLVAVPLVVVGASSGARGWWWDAWLVGLGVVVWAIGLTIEIVGDRQLGQFLADKRAGLTDAPFCTRGLWSRTRHPNYFGEAVLWWGIAGVALGAPWGWLGLGGAALVETLVRWVSGVPILERAWRQRDGFAEWAATTPTFFPRLTSHPRSSHPEETHT
ncbi:MAG: DUF1295 domain-containing protein [Thermoleophilia bacterium]|nr:DUF1295 domain-containing protein [Thermoleophilia bacterium]